VTESDAITGVELSGSQVIIETASGTSTDEIRAVPKTGGASNLLASALRAGRHIDVKHPFQALCSDHVLMALFRRPVLLRCMSKKSDPEKELPHYL
jgi:hypothetical protein